MKRLRKSWSFLLLSVILLNACITISREDKPLVRFRDGEQIKTYLKEKEELLNCNCMLGMNFITGTYGGVKSDTLVGLLWQCELNNDSTTSYSELNNLVSEQSLLIAKELHEQMVDNTQFDQYVFKYKLLHSIKMDSIFKGAQINELKATHSWEVIDSLVNIKEDI